MISLCTPTRGRPERFAEMLASAKDTATGPFEVVAWLDEDDPERDRYPQDPLVRYGSGPREYVDGVLCTSYLWTRTWELATGDIAMMCADDSLFRTPGWDVAVEAEFARVPDRIAMVYTDVGDERHEPWNPFVSREWIEAVGYFTPPGWPGWFSDTWVWALAAAIDRAVYLPDVLIEHLRVKNSDQTYRDGADAREHAGGFEHLRRKFYAPAAVAERDTQAASLRSACTVPIPLTPKPVPKWYANALNKAERNSDTLVVVHCYAGDRDQVVNALPLYLHHGCPVLILSPEDAPVEIDHPGVECRSAGKAGYFGQESLDRQRQHLEIVLSYPQNHFLLNDSDSFCLSPKIPDYLYEAGDVFFSNEVAEGRPHKSPYPKVAFQPPFFTTRACLKRMLKEAEFVRAHKITPFIDWYMVALACEAEVHTRKFPDGRSSPAWRHGHIPETKVTTEGAPRDPRAATAQARVEEGGNDGATRMEAYVREGVVFVHSVKHKEVLDRLVVAHELWVENGKVYPHVVFTTQRHPSYTQGWADAVAGRKPKNAPEGRYVAGYEAGATAAGFIPRDRLAT